MLIFPTNFGLLCCVASILCLLLQVVENAPSSDEALIECGRVHHIDIQQFPSSSAVYTNNKCALVCIVGNDTLPEEGINQGKACPEDTSGVCYNGLCIGDEEDALHECGLKHNLDFHKMQHHNGTTFTNDQCTLRCVISGKEWSVSNMHEGAPCPANPNGVCRAGTCVAGANPVTLDPTEAPNTDPTQPSTGPFSPAKFKLLNISLESTQPSLTETQWIGISYYETKQLEANDIANFYGDKTQSNYYNLAHISAIPAKLNKDSQINIDLYDKADQLTDQYVALYPVIETFYRTRKLAGKQENFVTKLPINRKASPNEKLMDVGLKFTIVFS